MNTTTNKEKASPLIKEKKVWKICEKRRICPNKVKRNHEIRPIASRGQKSS